MISILKVYLQWSKHPLIDMHALIIGMAKLKYSYKLQLVLVNNHLMHIKAAFPCLLIISINLQLLEAQINIGGKNILNCLNL